MIEFHQLGTNNLLSAPHITLNSFACSNYNNCLTFYFMNCSVCDAAQAPGRNPSNMKNTRLLESAEH